MEVLLSTDTKRKNSSEFFRFTPQLSRGRPRSGFTYPFRAAMWERSALPQSLAPRRCVRLTSKVWTWALRRQPLPGSLRQTNSVPSDRSVTSFADAAGMVLVVLMGSTLLCEDGRVLLAQISTISESSRCHTHPSTQRISRQRFSAVTKNAQ